MLHEIVDNKPDSGLKEEGNDDKPDEDLRDKDNDRVGNENDFGDSKASDSRATLKRCKNRATPKT